MDTDRLGEALEAATERFVVPGAQVGLLRGGDRSVVSSGVRRAGTDEAVERATRFHAGSIAKALAAQAVLAAARRGDLDLDAPCAEQGVDGWPETPRALLAQTTGRPNELPALDEELEDFVARVAAMPLVHPPGRFSYGNAGWCVLDLLLRRRCGASFEELALDPAVAGGGGRQGDVGAGGGGAGVFGAPADGAAGHAVGADGVPHEVPPHYAAAASAAGSRWWANADELLDLAALHLADGAGRSDPDDVRAMRTPAAPIPGATVADAWGLGWAIWERGEHRAFGWAGFTGGHRAYLRCFPDHDAALVVLTNAAGPLLSAPGGAALFDALLPELLAALGVPPLPPPLVPASAVPPQVVAVVGTYGPITVSAPTGPGVGTEVDRLGGAAPAEVIEVDGRALGEPAVLRYERAGGGRFVVPGEPPGSMPIAFVDGLLQLGPMALPRTGG